MMTLPLMPASSILPTTAWVRKKVERTFKSFELYLTAAAIYFAICFPLTQLSRWIEGRLRRS